MSLEHRLRQLERRATAPCHVCGLPGQHEAPVFEWMGGRFRRGTGQPACSDHMRNVTVIVPGAPAPERLIATRALLQGNLITHE